MSEKLEQIEIGKLQPHPKNPRLGQRTDVIESILAQLKKESVFSDMYALIVRPLEDGYQIVSGHHRWEAAKQAGLEKVPCWVKGMEDEEAFMQLVLANSQGELSPLEIGMHALEAVELGVGGRGKKGGLSWYAESLGKTQGYLSQVKSAAEVIKPISQLIGLDPSTLRDRAQHLAAIHTAPDHLWPALAKHLVKSEWSVADTKHYVKLCKQFEIPSGQIHPSTEFTWDDYLPPSEVIDRFLETREFSAESVKRLVDEVQRCFATIDTFSITDKSKAEFAEKAAEFLRAKDWDRRRVEEFSRSLKAELERREKEDGQHWALGNWRDHVDGITDGSVALLLTDPPYGMGYQSDYRLDRRKPRKHKEIESDATPADAVAEIGEMLAAFIPKLKSDAAVLLFCHWQIEPEIRKSIEAAGLTVRNSIVWDKKQTGMGDPNTTFAPRHERILFAVKGSPTLFSRPPDVLECQRQTSENHPTEKPVELLKQLIAPLAAEHELVVDPFGGVASTLVAAKEINRDYWGCEVVEKYHEIGDGRLR